MVAESAAPPAVATAWTPVCPLAAIIPDTGVCALVGHRQIAVVRLADDRVFAIGNFDPFSKAFVMSRGIVGSAGGKAKIASPIYKQCFDLATGRSLDQPEIGLASYPCRVVDGVVHVGVA
jgi:nitrite reductase (NADH) small subunit